MEYQTRFGKLVGTYCDFDHYVTLVFQWLDTDSEEYGMMVKYPNWQGESPCIGDTGFVKFNEVRAGIDQWFDGASWHYYKYDDVVFQKFVEKKPEQPKEFFL